MNKHIYEKMAITNIKKNGKIYIPYLITVIGSMMFYFILNSIGTNSHIYNVTTGEEVFKGASTLCGIIQNGSFASSIFIFIFLLYANSFVLKHQKKQFGLYRVLGIERKHMIKIIFTEVAYIYGIGIVAALFLGILFDKLMLVFLFKIIGQKAPEGFYINVNAIIQTLILLVVIAALILVFNTFSMLFTKDIDLLKSEKAGEKEPKNRPIHTTVGVIALCAGYYIALTQKNTGEAVNSFFPAALLVMYATYVLFISGIISLLKLLKKNKKYYYTTKHFISVSGMIYRMKQNAAGLATICILSTAAIIVLSAGVSLYANGERSINEQFPREIQLYFEAASGDKVEELLEKTMNEEDFNAENMVRCTFGTSMYMKTADGIMTVENMMFTNFEEMPDAYVLTLDEYNRFNQTSETLEATEILLYSSDDFYTKDTLAYNGVTYEVKKIANDDCLEYITNSTMALFSKLLIVVPNEEVFNQFIMNDAAVKNDISDVITMVGFDSAASMKDTELFMTKLDEVFVENGFEWEYMLKESEREAFYSMYGGILFVGAILGVMFILCTVMIIYYKQISEGYEDRERFAIMQKVGLSKDEIKSVIHSQIMSVFFIPLVTAIIHAAVALKIVAKCLEMVVIIHTPTFIVSVALTCAIFSIIYIIVYKITSKEYYNIVNS